MQKNLKGINSYKYLYACLLLLGIWSCEPQEEKLDPQYSGGLSFSTDTVFFDTLFTTRGSITKRFYAANRNDRAVKVSTIALGDMENSPYEIAVNGIFSKAHHDITILGNDSILVLVKAEIDPKDQNLPFLVKDSVVFQTNSKSQNVKLVAWGQDAHFLGDEILPCDSKWTNDKPYVLYSSILIDSLCTLEIEKGVRVFCAPNTFIYVKGSLSVHGEATDRVVIRNDRFEPKYQDALGQWGGILFLEGSHNNRIAFTTIRNGQTAIRLGSPDNDTIPDIILKNVIIENMSEYGILSFSSDVYADNTLVDNCKELTLANLGGGNYTYLNCTFANYSFDFVRESPATAFTDNITLDDGSEINDKLNLTLINNIIYGDLEDEILFNVANAATTLSISNNLIKSSFEELDVNNNIRNEEPKFTSPFNFEYQLDSLSPAIDKGLDIGLEYDLDSAKRDSSPDIGAYEFIP